MKTVVITGGSQGIGEALVKEFNKKNYQVVCFDIAKPNNPISNVIYEVVDIRDDKKVNDVAKKYPHIDVLVNNAAKQYIAPLKELKSDEIKEMIEVNALGTVNVSKAFLKAIKGGLIINVGSVHSSVVRKNKIPYDMSKAAINMFTKELALELEEDNTRVIGVEFGAVKTPMNNNFDNKEELEAALSKQVIKHLLTSEECAEMIYALTTDAFKYMNGSIVTYDCGRSLK